MSEIRFDRIHQKDVIIAPERLHRPSNLHPTQERRSQTRVCPFCEGNEKLTPPEIFALRKEKSFRDESGWSTRVVPNLFKAVQIEAPHTHHYGHFEYWDGFGAHEVLIDTPHHTTSMTQWSEQNAIDWLTTLAERLRDLRRDSRIASISIFKNEGIQAGATQPHSHTQLIGMPIIPKMQERLFNNFHEHFTREGSALLALIVEEELEANPSRIIAKEGDFVAFCPYASSFAFEIFITSHKDLGELDTLTLDSKTQLSRLLLDLLQRLKKELHTLDFNLTLSTPKLHNALDGASRFYIRIMPRIYTHGGFELGSDIFINPVAPELAAKLLRGEKHE